MYQFEFAKQPISSYEEYDLRVNVSIDNISHAPHNLHQFYLIICKQVFYQ